MSMFAQQAFQQPMPLWQENWMTCSPPIMLGTTGLCGNGMLVGWDMKNLDAAGTFGRLK